MGSSSNFSLTNGCCWEIIHFLETQKVSIKWHFNPMPNVLPPGPDSFCLMYLNTGCGDKLKYSNNVFICKSSMWNANCAQANGCSWETVTFLAENVSFQGNFHRIYAKCSTIWSDSACCTPVPAKTKHVQSSERIISQKACEFIIQILYISFLH